MAEVVTNPLYLNNEVEFPENYYSLSYSKRLEIDQAFFKRGLKTEESKKWLELDEMLQDIDTFGLFNIFMCHPRNTWKNLYVKLLPLVLLFSQVIIPLALLASQMETYDGGFCPNVGTRNEKALMFAIALMYTARSSLVFSTKYEEWQPAFLYSKECMPMSVKKLTDSMTIIPSILNHWGQVDDFMSIQYEGLLYLFNLWLIFISDNSIDMVLNSLAMEMVMRLDEDFKEYYFRSNGLATMEVYKQNLLSKGYPELSTPFIFFEQLVMHYGTLVTFYAVPLISAVVAIYSPFCK